MDNRDIVAATLAAAIFQKVIPNVPIGTGGHIDAKDMQMLELHAQVAFTIYETVLRQIPPAGRTGSP